MILSVIPWDGLFGEEWHEAVFGWSAFLTGDPLGFWWFGHLAMWFFMSAIVIGLIGGLGEKGIVTLSSLVLLISFL